MNEHNALGFLSGGGAAADLIRHFDWASTFLGASEVWPQGMKSVIGIILRSPVPMVTLWGRDGVMIYNDAYSVFAGDRHPHLLGSKVREGWAEIAEWSDGVMRLVLAGETLAYRDQELTLQIGGKRRRIWLNLDYSPILDESGTPMGVIAIVVETTAKVRAERWLNGERERLRQMFQQAPGFVAMLTGKEHTFDLVNPAFLQLIGHRDVLGKPVRSALPDIEGQGFFETLDKVLATGEPVSGNALPVMLQRVPGAAAEQRFIDLVYQPIRNDTDEIIGIFAQGVDVTDRILAEKAVRAREAQFSTFAQAMPNQVWTSLPDGTLDWFNARTYEFSGVRAGELDGHGWTNIVHPDDLPLAAERWAAALETQAVYEVEFRIRRHDSTFRWHLVRAVPLRDPAGVITRWIGTNTDIDDQKLSEFELSAAKFAAEEANLAKSTFIANMSHELRTPLSAIIGYSEMMLEEIEDGGDSTSLAADMLKIENNARHLLGLINDVLDLSKVESGKMEIYAEDFDVEPVMRELATTVESLVGKKNNRLDLHLASDLGTMRSDLTKVRQVLLNLISNAAKFTEDGTITLAVSREVQVDGVDRVIFRIADSGIGMSEEQLAKLFQRFQQADSSTTRMFGGTGLGLSLTKAFTDMLGGDVEVDSVPGEGSTFTVRLPVTYVPQPDELAEPEAESPAVGDGDELGDNAQDLVLVIDDDPDQRALMTRFLHREGFRVQTASEGMEGLELARKLQPRAILLDVMMPGIDGWSVLSELKADPELSAIPVVMVTFIDQRSLAASLGAADYMMKPVRWDRFSKVMDRFRAPEGGVLIVEDNADVRQQVRLVLEKDGWIVTEAENGHEGLSRVAAARPQVVLLDLTMPVMDGFTFLEKLRAMPGCADLPVVVLTARDLTRDDRRLLRGASQILNKGDVSLRSVAERLHQLADESHEVFAKTD